MTDIKSIFIILHSPHPYQLSETTLIWRSHLVEI
jgi:hypothetical protein